MNIIWDENKNQENIKKHKVSFEEAGTRPRQRCHFFTDRTPSKFLSKHLIF